MEQKNICFVGWYLRFIKLLLPVRHLVPDNSSDILNDHRVLFYVSSSIQAQALQKNTL